MSSLTADNEALLDRLKSQTISTLDLWHNGKMSQRGCENRSSGNGCYGKGHLRLSL